MNMNMNKFIIMVMNVSMSMNKNMNMDMDMDKNMDADRLPDFLNAGMPDYPVSSQSGTGMKKTNDAGISKSFSGV
jgi:hypothetical protein